MTAGLVADRTGPAVSIQDLGRPGWLKAGLSRGGAADRSAFIEGLALLDLPLGTAGIEMAELGGRFRFQAPMRFALTGATMSATLDGERLDVGASHFADAGAVLEVGAAARGVYTYLLVAGGVATPLVNGGRGFHGIGGIGRLLRAGDAIPVAPDPAPDASPSRLERQVGTGPVRIMPGPQTGLFARDMLESFEEAVFVRNPRANRQGVRLDHDGAPFATRAQLNQVSDFIAEGDVQMTGDGMPCVLLAECQTMGGYPRIGTVLPTDLPRVAQARAGEELRFRFVTVEAAAAAWRSDEALLASLKRARIPHARDPRELADLLAYDLIGRPPEDVTEGSGVLTSGGNHDSP